MSHTQQFLLCLLSISAAFFSNDAEARSTRRLFTEGIIGGENADEGQFPYQVLLQTNGKNRCGGSILTALFIITAAHCVIDANGSFRSESIKVLAGINDLESESSSRITADVVEAYVPQEFDPTVIKWKELPTGDIAILKLNKSLRIKGNSKIDKVKLAKKSRKTYAGKKATISGFGYNKIDIITDPETGIKKEANGITYGKLRFAEVNVLTNDRCKNGFLLHPKKQHICAVLVQRNKQRPEGTCSGDSGGPLVYNGIQIGVLSTSPFGCREDALPSIYTRVADYLDFIDKVVNGKIDGSIRKRTLKVPA